MPDASETSARLVREIFLAGFMAGLPADNAKWAAARLAQNLSDVRVRAGEVLYRRGGPPDAHFFVVSGEIKLELEAHPPWLMGERSLVGLLDVTLDRPRARTAVATRESFLLRLPASDWLSMLEDNFALTLRAIQGLSEAANKGRVELRDFAFAHDSPPPGLRKRPLPAGPLGLVDRILLLQGIPLFATAEIQALSDLAEQASEVTYAAGEVLLPRGAPSDAIYIVVSGAVNATRAEGAPDETAGPGMLVFGSSAVSGKDLGYEAIVTEPTRVLRVAREDYYDTIEEHFALARSTMKALAAERELLINEKERVAAARAEAAGKPP